LPKPLVESAIKSARCAVIEARARGFNPLLPSQRTINDCNVLRIAKPKYLLLKTNASCYKKALNLFVPPQTSSQGELLPVSCRADLSRTMKLVLALFLTAASTGAFAREFRASDTEAQRHPTAQAPHDMVAERTAGRHQSRQPGEDPAIAPLIERIRRVQ